MVEPNVVEQRIRDGVPGVTHLSLEDLTGTKDHYSAVVVSPAFEGKTRIEQHQMIYRALGELMAGPVHALALQTYTPDAWKKEGRQPLEVIPMDDATKNRIQALLDEHPIVLFMKGTKSFPQCGFSATVVEVMKRLDADYHDVNVLADPAIREGIKELSNWPTIPQLYVKGKLVGGCDIVRDMFTSGELAPIVEAAKK